MPRKVFQYTLSCEKKLSGEKKLFSEKKVNWRHLVAKFAINASGAMLLPSLVQVLESISGSVVPLAMFQCFPDVWISTVVFSSI